MKGTFLLIYSTFALVLNTCSIVPTIYDDVPEPSLPSCTWGQNELIFRNVELSIPSCVNLGWTTEPFHEISEPFSTLVYGGSANYGEFRWTSTSTGCNDQTSTRVTIFNTDSYNITSTLWNSGTRIDSALTVTGSSIYDVIGQASITINGLTNYMTGETISLIWDSPEYGGDSLFHFIDWIATAQVANTSNIGRVYIHNEYQ